MKKLSYESPKTIVFEVRTNGMLCASQEGIMWLLNGSSFSSEESWGRDGYGDASEF